MQALSPNYITVPWQVMGWGMHTKRLEKLFGNQADK
jgi:hypothetical protein